MKNKTYYIFILIIFFTFTNYLLPSKNIYNIWLSKTKAYFLETTETTQKSSKNTNSNHTLDPQKFDYRKLKKNNLIYKYKLKKQNIKKKDANTPIYVGLTFDDYSNYIEDITETLNTYNQSGTYYLLGHRLDENIDFLNDLVGRISFDHIQLENHSYYHDHFPEITESEKTTNITRNSTLINNIFNRNTHYFRPPYLDFDLETVNVADSLNHNIADFDLDSTDWIEENTSEEIVNHVINNVKNYDTIVMHLTEKTATYLPDILNYFANNNIIALKTDELRTKLGNNLALQFNRWGIFTSKRNVINIEQKNNAILISYILYDIQGAGVFYEINSLQRFWKNKKQISFKIKGQNTNNKIYIYIPDTGDERFVTSYLDNFSGWKTLTIPLSSFKQSNGWQPDYATLDNVFDLEYIDHIIFVPKFGAGVIEIKKIHIK